MSGVQRNPAYTEYLIALKERLAAATPGPWLTDPEAVGVYPDTGEVWAPMDGGAIDYRIVCRTNKHFQPDADATFIAHAPEDIDFLLGALKDARLDAEYWRSHYKGTLPLDECTCCDCMALRPEDERREMLDLREGR